MKKPLFNGLIRMRLIIPAVIVLLLFCGCGRDTHVRNKVYSVLPMIQQDIEDGAVEPAFAPEVLNPWVGALNRSKVVARLQIALEEMPQDRLATLWMLKAYAPADEWERIISRYPEFAAQLPNVGGYGEHPDFTKPTEQKMPANRKAGTQP